MHPRRNRSTRASTLDCFEIEGLQHVPKFSHGERQTGNALIQGENLTVLESLLPRYEAAVRCCYIDPPYNNQERHYHYHDSRDHRT
jgi:adenine-specific DNA-methyltransferase